MKRRRRKPARSLAWFLFCVAVSAGACSRPSTLPAALSDQEFWRLSEALSEPAGAFPLSDNFVSNEPHFADSVKVLRPAGGVYIGVGPEQNFSYIAGVRPAMAFIIDIRRENRNLHLLYKALFELSSNRADFVSRLFSRSAQPGLGVASSVDEIFTRYGSVPPSLEQYTRNVALVRERLVTTRRLPLSPADLEWIERAFKAFYADGPEIQFWGSRAVEGVRPSYRQLMTAKDIFGRGRSFLATEDGFRFVKDLQSRNAIVPVIGDFAGPSAIQRVGAYVREHRAVVSAFYGSNVGVYLSSLQTPVFCFNLATLPAPRAWFIEGNGVRPLAAKLKSCVPEAK